MGIQKLKNILNLAIAIFLSIGLSHAHAQNQENQYAPKVTLVPSGEDGIYFVIINTETQTVGPQIYIDGELFKTFQVKKVGGKSDVRTFSPFNLLSISKEKGLKLAFSYSNATDIFSYSVDVTNLKDIKLNVAAHQRITAAPTENETMAAVSKGLGGVREYDQLLDFAKRLNAQRNYMGLASLQVDQRLVEIATGFVASGKGAGDVYELQGSGSSTHACWGIAQTPESAFSLWMRNFTTSPKLMSPETTRFGFAVIGNSAAFVAAP